MASDYTTAAAGGGATETSLVANTTAITALATQLGTQDADNLVVGASRDYYFDTSGVSARMEVQTDEAGVRTVTYYSLVDDSVIARPAGAAHPIMPAARDKQVIEQLIAFNTAGSVAAGAIDFTIINGTNADLNWTHDGISGVIAQGGKRYFDESVNRVYKQVDLAANAAATAGEVHVVGNRTA